MAGSDEFCKDFANAEEELEYWKHQAHHFRKVYVVLVYLEYLY